MGTPYTLFLGHNLYQTFMNAYSLVNNQVRKKLDEMLKTWKEPVPGSLDLRPVFPVETTRPIENALIKARTLAVQQQQQQARSQQDLLSRNRPAPSTSTAWRNTPTPPQSNGRQPVPAAQGYAPQNLPNGNVQQVGQMSRQCLTNPLMSRRRIGRTIPNTSLSPHVNSRRLHSNRAISLPRHTLQYRKVLITWGRCTVTSKL